ncbi:MAG: hypothetical protein ABIS92_13945 [Polyangia bacterium]
MKVLLPFLLGFLLSGCDLVKMIAKSQQKWTNGTYIVTAEFDDNRRTAGHERDICNKVIDLYGINPWTKKMICATGGKTTEMVGISCVADDHSSLTSFVYADSRADSDSVWRGTGPVWSGNIDDDHPARMQYCSTWLILSLVPNAGGS